MFNSIVPESLHALQNFVRVGIVEQVDGPESIRVQLTNGDRKVEILTRFAMGYGPLPRVGDEVLVAAENLQQGFIIGTFPKQGDPVRRFSIEQDEVSGKTTISVPDGDLNLSADSGSIHLDAAQGIKLNCDTIGIDSAKGNFNVTQAQYQGSILGVSIERTKLFLGKLNSTIGRVIEKSKNVYRQVENLHQLKAGRVKTLVDNSYHLKGDRIVQKAQGEVRIDGEKINLG